MDIEQLKLILETVSGVTEGTKTVVLLYFLLQLVLGLVTPVGFLTALWVIVRFVAGPLVAQLKCYCSFLRWRDRMEIGGPGDLYAGEADEVIKQIDGLIAQNDKRPQSN